MYIGVRQKKKISLFLLIFVVILFVVSLLIWRNMFDLEPRNIVLSNVSEDSVTVTWVTDTKVNGFLILYENGERVGKYTDARGVGRSYTHYVDVRDLKPDTLYEFEIPSSKLIKSSDLSERHKFRTSRILSEMPVPNILSGFVQVNNSDVLVLLLVDDLSKNYPIASSVSLDGQWSFNLSDIMSANRSEFFDFRNDTPLKLLFYSNDGVKVIQGNKNVLFDNEGKLKDFITLDGSENIFSYVPDFAKFRGDIIDVEDVIVKNDDDVEQENILGAQEDSEVDEVVDEQENFREDIRDENFLKRLDSPSDYGFR